jgi:hypothetical protein
VDRVIVSIACSGLSLGADALSKTHRLAAGEITVVNAVAMAAHIHGDDMPKRTLRASTAEELTLGHAAIACGREEQASFGPAVLELEAAQQKPLPAQP